MTTLNHWHRPGDEPSTLQQPPKCCTDAFRKQHASELAYAERQHTETLRTERKRLILEAVDAVTAYGDAAASVLDETQAQLVLRVTDNAARSIKRSACICPLIDVTTFGFGQAQGKTIRGHDPHCGMHDNLEENS